MKLIENRRGSSSSWYKSHSISVLTSILTEQRNILRLKVGATDRRWLPQEFAKINPALCWCQMGGTFLPRKED